MIKSLWQKRQFGEYLGENGAVNRPLVLRGFALQKIGSVFAFNVVMNDFIVWMLRESPTILIARKPPNARG